MAAKLKWCMGVPALLAGAGGFAWWALSTPGPYVALQRALIEARPARPSGFDWQLANGKLRQFAQADADGRLVVWSGMTDGWRQTWDNTFDLRPETFHEMKMLDSPPLSSWWDKVAVPLRRLKDPNYRRMEAITSESTSDAFRPALLLADLDGDGLSDLVVIEKHLEVFKGSDDGRFRPVAKGGDLFEPTAPSLGVEDVDGDGVPELVVVCYLNEKLKNSGCIWQSVIIYGIEANGMSWKLTPRCQTLLTDRSGYHSTRGPTIADFDGDGRKEIIVSNDNGWIWVLKIADRELVSAPPWNVPSGGAVGGATSSGDLDGDGVPELLVGTNGGNIYACAIDTEGGIRIKGQAMAGRLAYGIAAGDFNNDGVDEMIVVRGRSGYAGMTAEDVKAELWTLDTASGTLRPTWGSRVRTRGEFQVTNLDGGSSEIIILSGPSCTVLRP